MLMIFQLVVVVVVVEEEEVMDCHIPTTFFQCE
jgi:hypothetical protein